MLLQKKIVGLTLRVSLQLGLVMVAALLPYSPALAAKSIKSFVTADDRFMALRDAAMHDDAESVQEHAAALSQYEIPSYVDYYVLRTKIRSASAGEMKAFFAKYEGSAIADRLRNDWLLVLGRRGDWDTFDAQYPQFVVADDTQLKCYALLSKAVKQQKVAAEARNLLTAPRDYADGCNSLVAYLFENGQFSEADLWGQMRMAAENSAMPLAQRLGKLLSIPEKNITQAIEKPASLLKKAPESGKVAHELYLIALGRAAKADPDDAAETLSQYSAKFTEPERAQGWAQIALQTAQKLKPEALGYWQRAEGASLSQEGYQWRVRTALREGDWRLVKSAIAAMPANLKSEPAWVYWYGRALANEGKQEEAQALFASIAEQMHFYGQLALEERGQKIGVPVAVKPVTVEELAPLASNLNLQRALKFYAMNLRFEGTREWNWELRKLNDRQHLVAAELARANNMLDRMVSTSDRTKGELDFNQRFPTPFNENMYKTTQALGVDMAWVYGLIRQESRFIMNAKSHVGASGLMQIMPATARYVAKKIGLGNFVPEQVNDIETNIALGTNYLNMVLTDLGGSQALASAAYNAGPGRPRAWRASLTRPVEGAIFAETIPFSETRGYVKNVLSNATYYAAIFEKKPQSLKARLGIVVPKGMSASDAQLP
ncbi:MAG: transglycosylase SLT domain-containing protein [Undibacterium sp.]|uniref:lytic transglycosylase domain-containing protein n=1 Tax=Undibacterium sp. TaxID=1914977 RepID=UPI002723C4EE|nr:lytic transglycosylase domain-containing protein [Undibacterium sp.]MDO8651092.1 transglycosylase SLT domain-containing protein [Undibacterium sp.]